MQYGLIPFNKMTWNLIIFFLEVHITALNVAKAWVWDRSLAGIAGSNPAEGMDLCFFIIVVCLSVRGVCDRPITSPEKSHRVWGCACDLQASIKSLWPTGGAATPIWGGEIHKYCQDQCKSIWSFHPKKQVARFFIDFFSEVKIWISCG